MGETAELDEAQEPPPRWHHRARGFVRERSGKQKVGGLAAVVLLLTAPFGGLKAEPAPKVARLHLDKVIDLGPVEVSIEKVLTLPDLGPTITPARKGDRLFIVEAKVRNPNDTPTYVTQLGKAFYGKGLGVVARPSESQPTADVYSVEDGSTLGGTLNPGVTYEVAIVFEQQAGWTAGTGAHRPVLGLNGYDFQVDDPLTLDPDAWILGDPLVEGPVDVEVKQ